MMMNRLIKTRTTTKTVTETEEPLLKTCSTAAPVSAILAKRRP
jgi:hypothetical protein